MGSDAGFFEGAPRNRQRRAGGRPARAEGKMLDHLDYLVPVTSLSNTALRPDIAAAGDGSLLTRKTISDADSSIKGKRLDSDMKLIH